MYCPEEDFVIVAIEDGKVVVVIDVIVVKMVVVFGKALDGEALVVV